ncbi:hypothetical protein DIPPA_28400 [Diplonema papillatum]|nr:hypothetical protein DIPPA_09349 [Diplonema papillatum]KAJ9435772.1 hypothetical protein DIPPA_28839 [Diplonema papillatum]KAJ9437171.1 hypothetical protein DIPPA_25859 [Diplonema papillatum]KAJ9437703.1 hypothetical protein DIPPA_02368 [Diplonema papillatum]KAJ9438311.1 hypothetical protein DIPPA_09597 [Diplonema papillatum]
MRFLLLGRLSSDGGALPIFRRSNQSSATALSSASSLSSCNRIRNSFRENPSRAHTNSMRSSRSNSSPNDTN